MISVKYDRLVTTAGHRFPGFDCGRKITEAAIFDTKFFVLAKAPIVCHKSSILFFHKPENHQALPASTY